MPAAKLGTIKMSQKHSRLSAGGRLKSYARPLLTKGPLLSSVTAAPAPSNVKPSDRRLKRDIRPLGRLDNGLALYRFRYLWSEVEMVGVIAQEALEIAPDAVILSADGFYRVDYAGLGISCTTYAEWLAAGNLVAAA